jgi:hypothetical protein
MTKAFQPGSLFRFYGSPLIYEFIGLIFRDGKMIVQYNDGDCYKHRQVKSMEELISV